MKPNQRKTQFERVVDVELRRNTFSSEMENLRENGAVSQLLYQYSQ